MKKMVFLRRLSQAFFLILFIYILWSTTYPLKGSISPDKIFKLDPLIMIMTSISERIFLPGVALSLSIIIITIFIGRFFCGWICPLGAIIDMAGSVMRRPLEPNDKTNAIIRKTKFYILSFITISALLGMQVAWVLDPIVIAARFVSMNLIPSITFMLNSFFTVMLKNMNAGDALRDFYRALKPTILGVKTAYFSHSLTILVFFLIIVLASLILRRTWCRAICPLGAMYALCAKIAPLKRHVEGCISCGKCRSSCRMGAIKDDTGYLQGECILCMDCIYDCPGHVTLFRFPFNSSGDKKSKDRDEKLPKISRKNFLIFALSPLLLMTSITGNRNRRKKSSVIRPPAALKEEEFINRCVRCGNCMKVCITNGLQPVMFQAGPEGIWTPQLVPEIGYCEYKCTLCGETCPTGAIPVINKERKMRVRLGVAEIDRSICLPWAKNEECIVCQEHCPVYDKAIKLDTYTGGIARPYVDPKLCIGCGICQNKCPVRPVRAIRVTPENADRTG